LSQKLFTLGPVEMYEYTGVQLPYFRTEEFSKIVLECAGRLKRLAGAPENAHVFLLTCSGTGAMEAVAAGCFNADDNLLVVDGGGFGHRFALIAEHHEIPYDCVDVAFDHTLDPGTLDAAAEDKNFTGLLVNLHESTNGQLYDIDLLASFCRAHDMYFVIDGIASFLADPFDFEEDGVDALIISSQKALALPPGLSIVIMSDRFYQKIQNQNIKPFSMYFDFREAETDAVRGQTPFTPAIGTIIPLRERLERIEDGGGSGAEIARVKELAEDFRARIASLIEAEKLALPKHPLSNACTPIIFPNNNAKEVYTKLAKEHGVWLNPNGGALADKVLRVGHLGNLTKDDNALLAGLLAEILT